MTLRKCIFGLRIIMNGVFAIRASNEIINEVPTDIRDFLHYKARMNARAIMPHFKNQPYKESNRRSEKFGVSDRN